MNKIGDVIYRQDAINAIENTECELTPAAWDEITDAINEVPSADIQPMRHGYWILHENQSQDDGNYLYVCSNCNHSDIHAKTIEVPYCWYCGAKMNEVE